VPNDVLRATDASQTLTQAERTAISDRAMLDAAIELILRHGTEKTTLAMIGEKAGYSRGLATYRFGSKAALYDTLCKSIGRNWLAYLKRGVEGKVGVDAMCAALDTVYQWVTDSPEYARVLQILHCGSASPGSEYQETSIGIHRRQQSDVVEWLRAGQREGQVREDVDVSAVAAEYVAYTSGITYLWLLSAETFNFDSANQAMKNYLRTTLSVHSQESI
jgi:AcrR family transcriptional regulator